MKKSHLIAGILIISSLSFQNIEAGRSSMTSTSSSAAKSDGVKNTKKPKATAVKKKEASIKSRKTGKTDTTQKTAQNSVKDSAKKKASSLTTSQKSKLLILLNEGSEKELIGINGIAKVRSKAIVKARPYKEIGELILVKGIGETTFTSVLAHAKSLPRRKSTNTSGKAKSKTGKTAKS